MARVFWFELELMWDSYFYRIESCCLAHGRIRFERILLIWREIAKPVLESWLGCLAKNTHYATSAPYRILSALGLRLLVVAAASLAQ